eukprot:2964152-Pyramimonas_sp.AAC.1
MATHKGGAEGGTEDGDTVKGKVEDEKVGYRRRRGRVNDVLPSDYPAHALPTPSSIQLDQASDSSGESAIPWAARYTFAIRYLQAASTE